MHSRSIRDLARPPGRLAIALLALLAGCGVADRAPPAPPHVVLVVMDTTAASHLSLYGYTRPTSPHLDRIASEGVVFLRAYATAPWTLPSHASLFTGLTVQEHGANSESKWTSDKHRLLAEVLADEGYGTYAFSANPFVSKDYNLVQGFQTVEHPWDSAWREAAERVTLDKLIDAI